MNNKIDFPNELKELKEINNKVLRSDRELFIREVERTEKLQQEIERLNNVINNLLDIADKEKVLVLVHHCSNSESRRKYEVTFDYDFLKSFLKVGDKK